MEITWHGNTCFTFKEKGVALIVNPDKESGKLKGDIILSSLKELPPVDGNPKIFNAPGEYEIKNIPIIGFRAWTKSKSKEEEEGVGGDPTILFFFEIGEVKVCHLGALGHVLTSEMVKEIGDVDILLVPGGKENNLSAKKAVEIIEAIDPKAVIPMGNGNLKEFMEELGAEKVEALDNFSIKSASDLPADKRTYVLLNRTAP